MKKVISYFSLVITFIIVFGISYVMSLLGICSQGLAFIYLLAALIFCTSVKILIGVLSNNYQNSKLLVILLMIGVYFIIWLLSQLSINLLNVEFEIAFQLITFGIALGRIDNFMINDCEKRS